MDARPIKLTIDSLCRKEENLLIENYFGYSFKILSLFCWSVFILPVIFCDPNHLQDFCQEKEKNPCSFISTAASFVLILNGFFRRSFDLLEKLGWAYSF